MITVLVPNDVPDHDFQFRRMLASATLLPFDPVVIDFIDALSKSVLLDKVMSRLPEMAAVAHWMRKAHLMELRASFEEIKGERIWLARGRALHFAPANVDSIFLYSWFLSMLVGNSNIVRLSQRRGEQVDLLLGKVNLLLQEKGFASIADRNLVLAYEHDEALTRLFSEACHMRVLWGGDESVRQLRAVPMNPLASEIVFANRFSLVAIQAEAVKTAGDEKLRALAGHFFNDSFWFDQMACSSPRLVVWVGSKSDCGAAQERFWTKLADEVGRHGINYPEVVGLDKMVASYVLAGTGVSDNIRPDVTGAVSRVHLAPGASSQFRNIECGGGLFLEAELPELEELACLLTEKDQTLAYFGFEATQLKKLALSLPTRAIDRIVPVGTALNFNTVWDGNNLLQCFSREIDLH